MLNFAAYLSRRYRSGWQWVRDHWAKYIQVIIQYSSRSCDASICNGGISRAILNDSVLKGKTLNQFFDNCKVCTKQAVA